MKINTKADWIYLREVLGSKEADAILARLEGTNVHWTDNPEARSAVAGTKRRQHAEYLEKAVPKGYGVIDLGSHNCSGRPDSWVVLVGNTRDTREEAVLAAQKHAKRLSDPVADDVPPAIDPWTGTES